MATERIMELLSACDQARGSVDQLGAVIAATNNATITALDRLLRAAADGSGPDVVQGVLTQAIVELRVASAQLAGGNAYMHWWAPYLSVYAAVGQGVAAILIMYAWTALTGWRRWVVWVVVMLLAPYLGLCWFVVVAHEQKTKWAAQARSWSWASCLGCCCRRCADSTDSADSTAPGDDLEGQGADVVEGEPAVDLPAQEDQPPPYDAVSLTSRASFYSFGGVAATAAQVAALTAAIIPPLVAAVTSAVGAAYRAAPRPSLYRWIRARWSAPGGRESVPPSEV